MVSVKVKAGGLRYEPKLQPFVAISLSAPAGQTGVIAGVCAVIAILLVTTAVIVGIMCCKKNNMDNYTSKRSFFLVRVSFSIHVGFFFLVSVSHLPAE